MGKHRDRGGDSPITIRWISLDGALVRATDEVRRIDVGLPPRTVDSGDVWTKEDV